MSLPRFYTTAEVAEALRTSEWWLCQQVQAGRVTPMRTSRARSAQMRWTEEDVAQLTSSLRPAPAVTMMRRRRRRAS